MTTTSRPPDSTEHEISDATKKKREWRLFLFITIVLFPALSVALVGSYGLFIWISQIIFGPPGA